MISSRSRTRLLRPRRVVAVACLAVSAALASACEKMPLLAPDKSTITVFAARNVVGINGSVEITAVVLEVSGTPVHNGTLVTFATTLGTMNPVEVRTQNGRATSTLQAGSTSGTAIVTAMSGGASAQIEGILVGAAAAAKVLLSANPTKVPASGGSVLLTATVVDESGNTLAGVPVNFQTTTGSLSASVVPTNADGQAQTQLTTSSDAEVTARAGGQDATVTITATAAPVVTLEVSSDSVQEGQPVTFTVTVEPGQNTFGIQSVKIDFGDGQSVSFGPTSGKIPVSHVYTQHGTFHVTATATDTIGQRGTATAIIYVAEIPPLQVTVTAGKAVVNQPVLLTAVVAGTGIFVDRVVWDFGDGTGATATGLSTTKVYTTTGTKVVKATVFATNGAVGYGHAEFMVAATALTR